MKYVSLSIKKYFGELKKNTPAPGGGSAAALSAAQGAALLLMAANYTRGDSSVVKRLKRVLSACLIKAERFIDEDAEAYLKLRRSFEIPKKNRSRESVIQSYLKRSASIPFGVCVTALDTARAAELLSRLGNKNLITDVGGGIIAADAAFNAARLNVLVNLKFIKDPVLVKKYNKNLNKMAVSMSMIMNKTMKTVYLKLS